MTDPGADEGDPAAGPAEGGCRHGCAARACGLLTVAAVAGILPSLVFLRVAGERASILGGLLYLPHLLWTVPFLLLGLLSLAVARRLFWVNAAAVAAVALGFADFSWGGGKRSADADLIVATNNVGQSNRQSPVPFFESGNPDVILLQEGWGGRFSRDEIKDRFRESRGEFVVLSRHPILSGDLVRVGERRYPVAARFEIAVKGKRVAFYNVHLPTPRGDLLRLFSPASVGELIEGTRPEGRKRSVRGAMRERVRIARELLAVFASEKLPMVAAGDFNMPGNGYLRRMFAGRLHDAFGSAGFGYGFTFPGYTRNPVALMGPWLRLDYVFASEHFDPVQVKVESGRGSQHRAVMAGFAFSDREGAW